MITRIADHALVARWRLGGFRSSHVKTHHGRVHVLEARGRGEGPTVVVLHGLAAAAHHYGSLLDALRHRARRVVGIDMPGHGHSELPNVSEADLTEALEDALVAAFDAVTAGERVILIGNSLGGAAAVRLATRRPDAVLGLFLVAPGGAPIGPRELEGLVRRFALESHGEALRFVDDLFHRPHPLRHALAWGTRRQFRRPNVRAIVGALTKESLLDPEEVRALAMPVHVLWGGADRILGAAHLRFWKSHLPRHGTLELAKRLGHVPHIDTLQPLVERIEHFLDRVTSEPAGRPDSRAVPAA